MFDLRKLEAVAEKIGGLLPPEPRQIGEELRRNLKPLVESALNRMELVTREEFDAQSRVLARTREKLETLEAQVAAMEQPPADPAMPSTGTPPPG